MKKKQHWILFFILFFSAGVFGQQMFQHLLGTNAYPDFTWTGLGGNTNWTTATNWSGNAVPGVGNTAHFFAAACSTNCSPTINANISVLGIDIQSGYPGTITQGSGFSVTIGTTGWSQAGGTFTGGNSAITMNGNFSLSAGAFIATSGSLFITKNINWTGGTFNASTGTMVLTAAYSTTNTLNFGTATLNNLKYSAGPGTDGSIINVTGTLTISGRLDIEDLGVNGLFPTLFSGGTFLLKGDVTSAADPAKIKLRSQFKIAGTTNQLIMGSDTAGLSNLEIISTGGTVTFSTSFYNLGSFTYTSGTVVIPTNLIESVEYPLSANFDSRFLPLNNLEIRQETNRDGFNLNLAGINTITGNLSFTRPTGGAAVGGINTGTFSVKGNLTSSTTIIGSAILKVSGTTSQTISGAGYFPSVEIISTGGTVTISGTPLFYKKFIYTSGAVSATGSTATFSSDTYNVTYTLTPGPIIFENVTFLSYTSHDGVTFDLGGANLILNGNLLFSQPDGGVGSLVSNGNITVGKNITASGTQNFRGTATIQINSSSATSIAVATSVPDGSMTSGKTGGTATLAANLSLNAAGQSLTISNGIFNLAGFNLIVNNILTVGINGKLICNGGTVTATSFILNGEVYCPTTLGTTWTGASGDHLWTTAGNWTNNTIPGASDVALFNSACTGTNCDVTINTSISVKGVGIQSSYAGTITQASGNTITIGTKGWSQQGGTFAGANSAISINGNLSLAGGTFTATSGTTTLSSGFIISGTPVFNANSGTISFQGSFATSTLTPGNAVFNNVTLGGAQAALNLTGTATVNGSLLISDSDYYAGAITGGIIAAKGDVTFSNFGKSGTVLIKISGAGNQTITGSMNAKIPSLEIASTGGTISLAGTLFLLRDYIVTSGTIAAGTSLLYFQGLYGVTASLQPGTTVYSDVTFGGDAPSWSLTGTFTIGGNLIFSDVNFYTGAINGGIISAKGNVTFTNYGKDGSFLLKISGSGNQTLTGSLNAKIPSLEMASTGGTVSLAGTLYFISDYTYTSGAVSAGTSTMYFQGKYGVTNSIKPGVATYFNTTVSGDQSSFTITGTMSVTGLLSLADLNFYTGSINSGTILAQGDFSATSFGKVGSTLIKVAGSGNQTITGVSGAKIPSFEVASTGGTVSYAGNLTFLQNFTHTSGTINAGTSTISFSGTGSYAIKPGTGAYNNITFSGNSNAYNLGSGTLTVNGILNLGCGDNSCNVNSGSLNALGDVSYFSNGYSGTATLGLNGSTSTTFNQSGYARFLSGLMTVNKTGGTNVSMTNDYTNSPAVPNLTIASGTLDLNGYLINIGSTLTINSGAILKCNGGNFTDGSLVNNGTINCPGYPVYPFNWTGAAADGNWNTGGNWSGGVAPSSINVAAFNDSYCGANCNVSIPTAITIRGVQIISPYSGTIAQTAANKITLGNRGWVQPAGNFVGAAADMDINGPLTITGGSFTAPSGILTLGKGISSSNNGTVMKIAASTMFAHNGGTVAVDTGPFGGCCSSTTHTLDLGANTQFNNISFSNSPGGYGVSVNYQTTNSVIVNGNLTQGQNVVNYNYVGIQGIWHLKSDLIIENSASGGDLISFILDGTGNQQYTSSSSGWGGGIQVNKSTGTVTPSAGTTNLTISSLKVLAGSFTAPTGTTTLLGDFNGTFDIFRLDSGTTWSHNNGTLDLRGYSSQYGGTSLMTINVPAGTTVNNLIIRNANDGYGTSAGISTTSNLTVNGNLTLADTPTYSYAYLLTNGSFTVKGNYFVGVRNGGGTANITLAGTSAQTITQAGTAPSGNVIINNSAGVSLMTATTFNSAAQNLSITAGSLDMAGYALTVNGLSLSSGTSVSRNAGVLTVNGSRVSAGPYGSGTISN